METLVTEPIRKKKPIKGMLIEADIDAIKKHRSRPDKGSPVKNPILTHDKEPPITKVLYNNPPTWKPI